MYDFYLGNNFILMCYFYVIISAHLCMVLVILLYSYSVSVSIYYKA